MAVARNDFFAVAGICVVCRQNSLDQAGYDVSNGEYWRSTMISSAARERRSIESAIKALEQAQA